MRLLLVLVTLIVVGALVRGNTSFAIVRSLASELLICPSPFFAKPRAGSAGRGPAAAAARAARTVSGSGSHPSILPSRVTGGPAPR